MLNFCFYCSNYSTISCIFHNIFILFYFIYFILYHFYCPLNFFSSLPFSSLLSSSTFNYRSLLSKHDKLALRKVTEILNGHINKEEELYQYLLTVYKEREISVSHLPPSPTAKPKDNSIIKNDIIYIKPTIRFIKNSKEKQSDINTDLIGNESIAIAQENVKMEQISISEMPILRNHHIQSNPYLSDQIIDNCSTVPTLEGSGILNSSVPYKKYAHGPQTPRKSFRSKISRKHEIRKLIRKILEEYSPSMSRYADRMFRDHLGREEELLNQLKREFNIPPNRNIFNGKSEEKEIEKDKEKKLIMNRNENNLLLYNNSYPLQYNSSESSDSGENLYMSNNKSRDDLHNLKTNINKLAYYNKNGKSNSNNSSPNKNRRKSFLGFSCRGTNYFHGNMKNSLQTEKKEKRSLSFNSGSPSLPISSLPISPFHSLRKSDPSINITKNIDISSNKKNNDNSSYNNNNDINNHNNNDKNNYNHYDDNYISHKNDLCSNYNHINTNYHSNSSSLLFDGIAGSDKIKNILSLNTKFQLNSNSNSNSGNIDYNMNIINKNTFINNRNNSIYGSITPPIISSIISTSPTTPPYPSPRSPAQTLISSLFQSISPAISRHSSPTVSPHRPLRHGICSINEISSSSSINNSNDIDTDIIPNSSPHCTLLPSRSSSPLIPLLSLPVSSAISSNCSPPIENPIPIMVPVPLPVPVAVPVAVPKKIKIKMKINIPTLPISVSNSPSPSPSSSRPASTFTSPRMSPKNSNIFSKKKNVSLMSSFMSSSHNSSKSTSNSPTASNHTLPSISSPLIPPPPFSRPSRRRSSPKTTVSPRHQIQCQPPPVRTVQQKEFIGEQSNEITNEQTKKTEIESSISKMKNLAASPTRNLSVEEPPDSMDDNISEQILYYRKKKSVLDL